VPTVLPITLVPRSIFGRLFAGLWFAACVSLLVFAYVQRGIHDMSIAFIWLLVFLTFPVGIAMVVIVGPAWSWLSNQMGITYDPFLDLLPYWVVLVGLGYAQWFIVLPALLRKALRAHVGT